MEKNYFRISMLLIGSPRREEGATFTSKKPAKYWWFFRVPGRDSRAETWLPIYDPRKEQGK